MRRTDEALKTMVSAQNNEYAPMTRLSQDAHVRTDAWSRAAQQVRERVASLGLTLDEVALALQDVRDLQAIYATLGSGPAGAGLEGAYNRVANCLRRVATLQRAGQARSQCIQNRA
jgi:hypothetical protein